MVRDETVYVETSIFGYLYTLRTDKIRFVERKSMYKDEILEEIHQYREKYAKSFNYDLKAIYQDLKKKQTAHSHKLAKLPIKRKSGQQLS